MKYTSILILIIASALIVGCSGYNQVLKGDDYGKKFELANEIYEGGQEVRSIALYEQVYQRLPKTAEGELSYFRIGKAYFIGDDMYMAGYYLGQFYQRFPSSPKAEDALFLSAMCAVQNSPESSLDQDETELAINDLQQFVDRFPNSNLIDSCNKTIDRLRYKIELKEFNAVKLYAKTENYMAAVSSGMTFMDDYPASQFKEEVNFILVKNSYLLYKNSVESKKMERIEDAIERYRTFVADFPESKYLNLLSGYNETMEKDRLELKEIN